jgi:hypothetical protein
MADYDEDYGHGRRGSGVYGSHSRRDRHPRADPVAHPAIVGYHAKKMWPPRIERWGDIDSYTSCIDGHKEKKISSFGLLPELVRDTVLDAEADGDETEHFWPCGRGDTPEQRELWRRETSNYSATHRRSRSSVQIWEEIRVRGGSEYSRTDGVRVMKRRRLDRVRVEDERLTVLSEKDKEELNAIAKFSQARVRG